MPSALPSCALGHVGCPLSELEQTALHEAGHAVSWHLGGGAIESIAIWREPHAVFGLCTYALPARLSPSERRLLARAALAANLLCDVAGCPDLSEAWTYDYEAAVEALRPLYKTRARLHDALADCWLAAAELMSCPAAWHCATALSQRLVACGKVEGFPDDCHILDQRAVPGLAAAAARLLGDFERAKQEDLAYAIEWVEAENAKASAGADTAC